MSNSTKLPWLWIIGIGDDGLTGLTNSAKRLIDAADVVVGGKRHLNFLTPKNQQFFTWPSPWSAMTSALQAAKEANKKVVVLTSGDPFWFGAGSAVTQHFERHEWISIPHPSSFQLAAHKLGWPLQNCVTTSLHGRQTDSILQYFGTGGKILALAESTTADELRQLLNKFDFEKVKITVLAHLSGSTESIYEHKSGPTEELAILALDLGASRLTPPLSGLPDKAFEHDGQLTKQEVRAITLSKLAPADNQVLWDLGAGCGSIAIEWCRLNQTTKAVAFERDDKRVAMMTNNAKTLSAFQLEICHQDFNGPIQRPAPDAIFIGGGLSQNLLQSCWDSLPEGGRLVANAVTLESEALLTSFPSSLNRDPTEALSRIAVERPIKVGPKSGWKPFMTVTQMALTK